MPPFFGGFTTGSNTMKKYQIKFHNTFYDKATHIECVTVKGAYRAIQAYITDNGGSTIRSDYPHICKALRRWGEITVYSRDHIMPIAYITKL